jgi:predicted O-methyltransferase YrrM
MATILPNTSVHPIRSIRYRVGRRARLLEEWYDGVRDGRRIRRAFPHLARYDELEQRSRGDLEPNYREYVTTVSPEGVPISLELAAFIDVLCMVRTPRRLLDLGSGFSSFVLRRYAEQAGVSVEVQSTDHASEWLAATRRYLEGHGLGVSGLSTWSDFRSREHAPFDLILLDLGSTGGDSAGYRLSVLPYVLGLLTPGGVLILDDAHRLAFGRAVRRLVDAHGYRCWSLKRFVQDRFGRFALIVTR